MSFLGALASSWPQLDRLLDEALPEHQAPLKQRLAELLQPGAVLEAGRFMATLPSAAGAVQPGDRVGPYRLVRELGEGGMGSVWLARRSDGQLTRPVALKLPRMTWARGLAERMARERDILATLEHPHIARLYDAGVDHLGRPWLALEYVQGRPIDDHARYGALGVPQRVELLLQVCDAVAYAHGRLVIHRDRAGRAPGAARQPRCRAGQSTGPQARAALCRRGPACAGPAQVPAGRTGAGAAAAQRPAAAPVCWLTASR